MKWTWHSQEHRYSSLPSNPLEALRHTTSMYPNILVLLSILLPIPLFSQKVVQWAERTKPLLYPSTLVPHLSGFSLLAFHYDTAIDILTAIDGESSGISDCRYRKKVRVVCSCIAQSHHCISMSQICCDHCGQMIIVVTHCVSNTISVVTCYTFLFTKMQVSL